MATSILLLAPHPGQALRLQRMLLPVCHLVELVTTVRRARAIMQHRPPSQLVIAPNVPADDRAACAQLIVQAEAAGIPVKLIPAEAAASVELAPLYLSSGT